MESLKELTNALLNRTITTPYMASSSPRLGVCNPATPPKTAIAIISGTGKATDFKLGPYNGIHSQGPSE